MNQLKYFALGIIFFYILQIFDVIINIINSYSAILVTKCQVKINELGGDSEYEVKEPLFGFHYNPSQDEDEYEEIDGDYVDKAKK